MGKKSGSGSGINYLDHISKSLETIFWVKSLMRIRDGKNSDPVWEKIGSRILDKHPGSETLFGIISDPIKQ